MNIIGSDTTKMSIICIRSDSVVVRLDDMS